MSLFMLLTLVFLGIKSCLLLTGKPVAVTSNRGTGRAPLRPGANPQLEWQYYQNRLLTGKAGMCELTLRLESSSGEFWGFFFSFFF